MSPFGWAVAAAAVVALAGSAWRLAGWRRLRLGDGSDSARRTGTAAPARGAWAGRALTALVLDALGQRRLLRRDPVRWAAHLAIAVGVLLRRGLVTMVGVFLFVLSLGADLLEVGHAPGLGWRSYAAFLCAAAMVSVGAAWRRALARGRGVLPGRSA